MTWLVLILGIGLDRLSKWLAVNYLPFSAHIPIIGDFFSLKYIQNEGAAWSILSGKIDFLIIVTLLMVIAIAILLWKTPKKDKHLRFSYALVLAGGIGNLIDRIFYGYVVDFLCFPNFPVFNIADCCVTVGIFLIIVFTFAEIKKDNRQKKQNGNK